MQILLTFMTRIYIGDAMFIADGLTEEGTDVSGH